MQRPRAYAIGLGCRAYPGYRKLTLSEFRASALELLAYHCDHSGFELLEPSLCIYEAERGLYVAEGRLQVRGVDVRAVTQPVTGRFVVASGAPRKELSWLVNSPTEEDLARATTAGTVPDATCPCLFVR